MITVDGFYYFTLFLSIGFSARTQVTIFALLALIVIGIAWFVFSEKRTVISILCAIEKQKNKVACFVINNIELRKVFGQNQSFISDQIKLQTFKL